MESFKSWWNGSTPPKRPTYQQRQRRERDLEVVDSIDNSISQLKMRQQQDQAQLTQVEQQLAANKQAWLAQGASGKQRLRMCLQKRNRLLAAIAKTEGHINNFDTVHRTAQDAALAATMANTMVQGNEMLSELAQEVQVEDVEDVYSNFQENAMELDQLSNVMSAPIMGGMDYMGEQDIDAEIAAMELQMEQQHDLPSAPTPASTKQPSQQEEKQRYKRPV